jgi:transcriptional regulator with XRE-family HTH domain
MRLLFAERLRAERERRNLTQEVFADLCELHRTYIGGVERGERNLSIDSMERIANALELPLFEMLRRPVEAVALAETDMPSALSEEVVASELPERPENAESRSLPASTNVELNAD